MGVNQKPPCETQNKGGDNMAMYLKRHKVDKRKSQKMFKATAYPVKMNKLKIVGKGIKRGGTRL